MVITVHKLCSKANNIYQKINSCFASKRPQNIHKQKKTLRSANETLLKWIKSQKFLNCAPHLYAQQQCFFHIIIILFWRSYKGMHTLWIHSTYYYTAYANGATHDGHLSRFIRYGNRRTRRTRTQTLRTYCIWAKFDARPLLARADHNNNNASRIYPRLIPWAS